MFTAVRTPCLSKSQAAHLFTVFVLEKHMLSVTSMASIWILSPSNLELLPPIAGARAQQLPCGKISADGRRGPLQCPPCRREQVVLWGPLGGSHTADQLASCQLHHACQLLPRLETPGRAQAPAPLFSLLTPASYPITVALPAARCRLGGTAVARIVCLFSQGLKTGIDESTGLHSTAS